MRIPIAVLILGVCVSCSNVRPHGSTSGGAGLGPVDNRPASVFRPNSASGGGATEADSKVVCRSSASRDGWVITDFVAMSGCTGADANRKYAGALIVPVSQKPLGAVIRACADQHVPNDWAREVDTDTSPACTPEDDDRKGAPATIILRRVR